MVGGAVERPLCGELQGVDETVALHTERTVQLEQGVADVTGAVVNQLQNTNQREAL